MSERMVKLTIEHELPESEVREWAELEYSPYEGNMDDAVTAAARRWVAEHPEQRPPREVVEALLDRAHVIGQDRVDLRRVLAELPPDGHVAVHLRTDPALADQLDAMADSPTAPPTMASGSLNEKAVLRAAARILRGDASPNTEDGDR